ncbi:DUF4468 domain-containing protein [Sphingobacterium sp. UT-1RO-CII-1]|uniref:DUF4468 domain-containing protein n=1 Tax=Sphingobacterium sp. UT-1RO-CII-1 TaxID=2995225 RepID=UPI00227C01DC|nr:DUF4468 domain-containing protein [Sphingobacterium sp. UT-1RO-CII-1]MCY4781470.1 DUF4468 domain-containing protein [Sphingobacterium sp. UT-1RO-CII-1]
MKQLILVLFFISAIAAVSKAQDIPYVDDRIVYEHIFDFPGSSKDELYSFSKISIADAFVNANYVVQSDDSESGIIVGKGVTSFVRDFKNLLKLPRKFKFSVRIDSKDERVRIRLYDIIYIDELSNPRRNTEIPFELLEQSERQNIGKSKRRLEAYNKKSEAYNDHFYSLIVLFKRGIEKQKTESDW